MTDAIQESPIKAIFFDLDNTLIETRKADRLACNKLTEILQQEYSVPHDVATVVCNSYLKNFRLCPDNPAFSLDTWRSRLWTEALGKIYSHLSDDIYHRWLKLRYHYLMITADTRTLLTRLKQNYLLAVISNGPSCAQWEKVQLLNLSQFFDLILVSGDLPWEKPNKRIFQQACTYLGIEPNQCIMVGDKLETDIQGGIQAGLAGTVWIPIKQTDLGPNDPHPDYTIDKVTDLVKVLPKNTRTPIFHRNFKNINVRYSLPDFEDCNSNSSDGS